MSGIFSGIAILAVVVYLIVLTVPVVDYVLTALAVSTLAKRRGIACPWLAWIPVASNWTFGSLADEYDRKNGMERKWRLVLLILAAISTVALMSYLFDFLISIIDLSLELDVVGADDPSLAIIEEFVEMYFYLFFVAVASSALQMCKIVCAYKIYESTVPKKSVLFLLLTILVPFGSPICLMLCRNAGYPIKQQPIYVLPNPEPAPVVAVPEEPQQTDAVCEPVAETAAAEECAGTVDTEPAEAPKETE